MTSAARVVSWRARSWTCDDGFASFDVVDARQAMQLVIRRSR